MSTQSKPNNLRVLVVGGGGREHALAWKIAQSPRVAQLFVAPGNAGTAAIATNLPISASNIPALLEAATRERIDLAVIGPEAPLSEGIVDLFTREGIPAFGPSRAAARIEGSKAFARDLMEKYGIPCAGGATFASFDEAAAHIKQQTGPLVVKADGLAAGKGVFVTTSQDEALKALSEIMEKRAFGDAGNQVIVEECLTGKEVSLLAFSDGNTVVPMVPACDYKRAYDNDEGPNTGGMGSYSPPGFFDDKLVAWVMSHVLRPMVRAMAKEGSPYKGVLYAGLMITESGPKVLEFNARFGDPETQVILPRLKTDPVDILLAVVDGTLAQQKIEWSKDPCVGVVLASGGYPGSYTTGYPITGLNGLDPSVTVFHAGTKLKDGQVVTDGGRVLNVVACGEDMGQARGRVYRSISGIQFRDRHYRKDIAAREMREQRARMRVEKALAKCPLIDRYFRSLIEERRKLPFPEGNKTDSIAMIGQKDAKPARLERLLERTCNTPGFDSIFEKLGNEPDPDEKIYDALAVIQVIDVLKEKGYTSIEVVPRKRKLKTVDLTATYGSEDWAIEVKHIRGVEIKALRAVDGDDDLGYEMNPSNQRRVARILKRKIGEAIGQIEDFCAQSGSAAYKRAAIVASRRAEFWLFPIARELAVKGLFKSYYAGKLDGIALLCGFYEPEVIEYPTGWLAQTCVNLAKEVH